MGEMVKIGVFADTHVGRSIPNAIADYRRQAFRHAFTQAIDIFIKEGVELVIHAGDLFERRSMTAPDSLFVKEELQRLVDSLGPEVRILMVRGNHDGTPENSTLDYVLHPLAKYLGVLGEETLQGKPNIYESGDLAIIGFGYTPYTSSKLDEVKEAIKEKFNSSKAEHKIFLAHMFVEGQDIPPNVPEYQVAKLNTVEYLGANMVIAGHYHEYILAEKPDLYLLTPGATESIDLSDDSPHGVCILNLDQHVDCKFLPIKPLYRIKNEVIDSEGAVQQPQWFIERAFAAANEFSDMIRKEKEQGILRIALRGFLDGNRFDLEAEIERQMRDISKENPNILHIEVDNDLSELRHVGINIPEHMSREEFLQEVFNILGENLMAQALTLAEEVRMALEERASTQTGLLKESDRAPFVEKWLKIMEAG
jgi:DNA repair exonuclease SbcCD nuclease subunit